ncbi:hypothetical protein EBU95_17250 [bacterium]|nr:hypothetical protein [bacterium]
MDGTQKCKSEKSKPLYVKRVIKGRTYLIRVCQDCGYSEDCHGPDANSQWRHLFVHPDYPGFEQN